MDWRTRLFVVWLSNEPTTSSAQRNRALLQLSGRQTFQELTEKRFFASSSLCVDQSFSFLKMWESKFSWQVSGIWSSLFVSGVKWLAGRNNLRDHLKDQLGERVATGRMCNVSQGGEVQWIPDTGFHSLKRPIPSPMDATHSAVAFL